MRQFLLIWLGQLVTLAGSALTAFAIGVQVYRQSGSVSQLALLALVAVLPAIVAAPVAGVVADQWNRRWAMILGEAGAGLATLWLLVAAGDGRLRLWQIYGGVACIAACVAFEVPAYSATVTQLVSTSEYGRAGGMMQLGPSAAELLSPLLAGYLVVAVGLRGILLVDASTYLFAIATLCIARIPPVPAVTPGFARSGSSIRRWTAGWRYIARQPGLPALVGFFAATAFVGGMINVLIVPLVLAAGSVHALGAVLAVAGVGLLMGGTIMSAWGGPRRRILGVLGFEALSGLCLLTMGLRPSIGLVAAGAFGAHVAAPVVNGSNQAIWQRVVPPDIQGRVFATRQMLTVLPRPVAYLIAGPLADRVFEPLLSGQGSLTGSAGRILGTGSGRGIGLMFVVMGLAVLLGTALASLSPGLRSVETAGGPLRRLREASA